MAYNSAIIILALFASFLTTLLSIPSIAHGASNANYGFSVEFIHRDSPRSPFYNPSETDYDRLRRSISRSTSRLNRLSSKPSLSASTNTIESELAPDRGEFLMNISIGTPPVILLGIADTGSDLIWTQCKPCDDCYKQAPPLFDSQKSSSYKELSCESSPCQALSRQTSCSAEDTCQYSYSYGDTSSTQGDLASETLTFDSTSGGPVVLKHVTFGCGHTNIGTFSPNGSGLVGLGGGPVSLISQLGDRIGGKFSYCLTPLFTKSPISSTLNFGSKGVVSGEGVVSTPRVTGSTTTFYYLTLEGFTVGSKDEIFSTKRVDAVGDEGNIIIDSGTTLTYLPNDLLQVIVSGMTKAISLKPVQGPQGLDLCYNVGSSDEKIDIPTVTAHFSGADVVLNPVNTFIRVDESTLCLAFAAANVNQPIFGNIAQINFLVGYDLEAKTISFKPTDCTKH